MPEELTGANVGEVAETPIDEHVENEAETGQEDIEQEQQEEEEQEQEESEQQKQRDLEKDAAYAEARRAKEEAETLRRKIQTYEAKVKQHFGNRGITNLDGYFNAVESTLQSQGDFIQQERQNLENRVNNAVYQMRQEGYDDATINMWVDNQRTKFDLWAIKQEREQEKKVSQQTQAQQQYLTRLNSDFEAMKKKYPGVVKGKGEDLNSFLANSPELYNHMVNNPGVTLRAAFLELYEDQIIEHNKKAATQKALRQVGSKDHLGTEKSGEGDIGFQVDVTPEKMRIWKQLGYTEKQARQKEAKYMKMQKAAKR